MPAGPTPAEIYDTRFVPALFAPWADVVAAAAGVAAGHRVLDVACGTGVLARAAARRAGPGGTVAGLDPNPDMLAVARRHDAAIAWHEGVAEDLPFDGGSFDAVASQFGYMFFTDRPAALREMKRVLAPRGRLAVAVCDAVDHAPGYAVLAELLERLFGHDVAQSFRAPFACGDPALLREDCRAAGLDGARVDRHEGTVRFDSVADLVATERACVWTLGGLLDDDQFARLAACAEESLRPFVGADGRVAFSMPALIVTAET